MTGIRCSGIFIVNLEHISHLLLVFLLLTLKLASAIFKRQIYLLVISNELY